MLLNDLLSVLAARIDHARVVKMFQKADELPSALSPLLHDSRACADYSSRCSDQILSHRGAARKSQLSSAPWNLAEALSRAQNNIPAVNESYNELLIEDEDYKTLRDSTDSQDAFDSLGLAARLEKHDLLEFRRREILRLCALRKQADSCTPSLQLLRICTRSAHVIQTACPSDD